MTILPFLLAAAGLYLVTRMGSSSDSKSTGQTLGGNLITEAGLSERFEKDLSAYKAAIATAPAFKFDNDAEARKSFFGDDDRARALAMAEWTLSSAGLMTGFPKAASDAAARLAVDYRDKFELLGGRGEAALRVISATMDFVKKAQTDVASWENPTSYKAVDDAMVRLVVDSPSIASLNTPVNPEASSSSSPASFTDQKGSADLGKGKVNVSDEYRLRSSRRSTAGGDVDAFIGRIEEAPGGVVGKYVLVLAPAFKTGKEMSP